MGEEPKMDDKSQAEDDGGKGDSDAEETTIPTSLFGGRELKVGQRETIEITGIHDKQVSVKCVYNEDKEESGEDDSEDAKASVPSGMGGDGGGMYD